MSDQFDALRYAAHRCTRYAADVALLCESALAAADAGSSLSAELSRLRADADDAARYRAFFDAGLPITFLGESYETKEELDAAIDRARSAAQGGSDG